MQLDRSKFLYRCVRAIVMELVARNRGPNNSASRRQRVNQCADELGVDYDELLDFLKDEGYKLCDLPEGSYPEDLNDLIDFIFEEGRENGRDVAFNPTPDDIARETALMRETKIREVTDAVGARISHKHPYKLQFNGRNGRGNRTDGHG